MNARRRHPQKEIAEALDDARAQSLDVEESHRVYRWGRVVCPGCGTDWRVPATSRNAWAHGRLIARFVEDHRDDVWREGW